MAATFVGVIFLGEKLSPAQLGALILSLAGLLLATAPYHTTAK
jgi:drug/metabolite transporter (DMT)-like permease